jgi:Asp-tRNA(Asn)/Glu-tRNA(Gln) amidotransferase A subunit family amidase
MTRTVRDAILAHEILAARTVARSSKPLSAYRFAVAQTSMLDGLDANVARAFDGALRALRAAGAQVQDLALTEIRDLGAIQSTGGFTGAESYAWHRTLLEQSAHDYDPRVKSRIERGAAMKAYEYIELVNARQEWMSRVAKALQGFDAVLSPTVPIAPPSIAQVAPGIEHDAEFFRVNALLLRNPSVINMLDGCAISIPCHGEREMPAGLMIWQSAMHDDAVLNIALQAEAALKNNK